MSNIWIIYGLGASRDSDGSGLRLYADIIKARWPRVNVQIFQENDELPKFDGNFLPIVIAHSYGVSTAWKWLGACTHLFMIDGVPDWSRGLMQWNEWSSANKQILTAQIDCYYRGAILPPWSCKLRTADRDYRNHYISGVNHWNIVDRVRDDVMERLKAYVS